MFLVLCASSSNSFSSLSTTAQLSRPSDANRLFVRDGTRTFASAGDNDDKEAQDTESSTDNPAGEKAEQPEMRTSTVRIDDGGSNLTDRFKYKVRTRAVSHDMYVALPT